MRNPLAIWASLWWSRDTARDGTISTNDTAVHVGRTTQVWDAVVRHDDTDKILALFRCTQAVLWPRPTEETP